MKKSRSRTATEGDTPINVLRLWGEIIPPWSAKTDTHLALKCIWRKVAEGLSVRQKTIPAEKGDVGSHKVLGSTNMRGDWILGLWSVCGEGYQFQRVQQLG